MANRCGEFQTTTTAKECVMIMDQDRNAVYHRIGFQNALSELRSFPTEEEVLSGREIGV